MCKSFSTFKDFINSWSLSLTFRFPTTLILSGLLYLHCNSYNMIPKFRKDVIMFKVLEDFVFHKYFYIDTYRTPLYTYFSVGCA